MNYFKLLSPLLLALLLSLFLGGCTQTEEESTSIQETSVKKTETTPIAAASEVTTQKVEPAVEEVKKVIVKKEIKLDGSALYKKCSACHGATAEKSALNKSEIIKGWDESKIFTALKGYQDGTYGGAMKGLMKGQVAKMTEEEMKILSHHIASF